LQRFREAVLVEVEGEGEDEVEAEVEAEAEDKVTVEVLDIAVILHLGDDELIYFAI